MIDEIPHSRPWITADDVTAVTNVLASAMLAQGDLVQRLERRFAAWLGATDGVAVGSGAAAIVLALRGLCIEDGDEVILPTYVCPSVLEAVLSAGAVPVLCDVGENWVMTHIDAERCVSSKTRAIIVPHMYGIFANISALRSLCIPIIEDCAQAIGAEGKHRLQGDVAVLSFHPTKCLTAGEGGMAVASESGILERMRAYRDGAETGYCARLLSPMSNIAAGLALSQADRYDEMLERRREIARSYFDALEICAPDCLHHEAAENSMFFRFPIRTPGGLESCQKAFEARGVHVRRGVDKLLHREMKLPDSQFPTARALFESTVSIPIYPALSQSQILRCIEAMEHVLCTRKQHLKLMEQQK